MERPSLDIHSSTSFPFPRNVVSSNQIKSQTDTFFYSATLFFLQTTNNTNYYAILTL